MFSLPIYQLGFHLFVKGINSRLNWRMMSLQCISPYTNSVRSSCKRPRSRYKASSSINLFDPRNLRMAHPFFLCQRRMGAFGFVWITVGSTKRRCGINILSRYLRRCSTVLEAPRCSAKLISNLVTGRYRSEKGTFIKLHSKRAEDYMSIW